MCFLLAADSDSASWVLRLLRSCPGMYPRRRRSGLSLPMSLSRMWKCCLVVRLTRFAKPSCAHHSPPRHTVCRDPMSSCGLPARGTRIPRRNLARVVRGAGCMCPAIPSRMLGEHPDVVRGGLVHRSGPGWVVQMRVLQLILELGRARTEEMADGTPL